MSDIKSKTYKMENNSDHKKSSKVTRYDFREFSIQLAQIQQRNKMIKERTVQEKASESGLSKRDTKKKVKQIMSQNTIDQRLETLEPKPNLKALFTYFDDDFFGGILHQNGVEVIWNKSIKIKANITQTLTMSEGIQTTYKIILSRLLFKNSPRKELTETLLLAMIEVFLMLTKEDFSLNDKNDRKLLAKKIKEINKMAKTDINSNEINIELNLNPRKVITLQRKSFEEEEEEEKDGELLMIKEGKSP